MISYLLQEYIYIIRHITNKMRKMLEAQFMLQGAESEIKKIEKEIAKISIRKEVIAFNSNGEIKKDEI